jgi:hypothetical protein
VDVHPVFLLSRFYLEKKESCFHKLVNTEGILRCITAWYAWIKMNFRKSQSSGSYFPLYSLRTDGDVCHQGRDTEIAPKFRTVETYWHYHS